MTGKFKINRSITLRELCNKRGPLLQETAGMEENYLEIKFSEWFSSWQILAQAFIISWCRLMWNIQATVSERFEYTNKKQVFCTFIPSLAEPSTWVKQGKVKDRKNTEVNTGTNAFTQNVCLREKETLLDFRLSFSQISCLGFNKLINVLLAQFKLYKFGEIAQLAEYMLCKCRRPGFYP